MPLKPPTPAATPASPPDIGDESIRRISNQTSVPTAGVRTFAAISDPKDSEHFTVESALKAFRNSAESRPEVEEPPYAALQREVQRRLGRCLIRIQQYEILLREMVAKLEVTGMLGVSTVQTAEASSALPNMTMGNLVGELTGKYFRPTLLDSGETQSDEPNDETEHPVGWMCFRSSVSMPPDAHAKLTTDLQELVDLRNDLVHHFVEGQDLVTEVGCIAADMYLHDCYDEIDRHVVTMESWAKSRNDALRSMDAFITSDAYKDFLRTEVSEPAAPREVGVQELVELLSRAEGELTGNGWTSLDAAIEFIRTVAPEASPRQHGFGSWRHMMSKSQAFDVRRGPTGPQGRMETRYRSRAGAE
ncbi:OST-HTH/LOTUS domain-containing protein [Rhodoferax saidenbachensis]|uniref:HTH OST-type domain-containing protein n=1 Tax=Rhodoferax saidenbachensis TaxID=1484693 RepID=A0ABU1ZQW6_9BURK|nr:OST-HTH/LOTUS domain-containing protein [Rhodoferax saidenbachensis]MDR7307941.1 hypothetical protein [Rhodoferax saidenbachensis]